MVPSGSRIISLLTFRPAGFIATRHRQREPFVPRSAQPLTIAGDWTLV
jgi:hypothetical protein